MAFLLEYLQQGWQGQTQANDAKSKANWDDTWNKQESERQRERIIQWRDRVAADDYAANSEEPEYYRRTAGFVWRQYDTTGKHKARNHQYLYNLAVHGHRTYSRRDPAELAAAAAAVKARAASGDLGPLSPLD